jgi:hypothetical protein
MDNNDLSLVIDPTGLKKEIIKAYNGCLPDIPLNWHPVLPDPNVGTYEFWFEPELSTTLDLYTKA